MAQMSAAERRLYMSPERLARIDAPRQRRRRAERAGTAGAYLVAFVTMPIWLAAFFVRRFVRL